MSGLLTAATSFLLAATAIPLCAQTKVSTTDSPEKPRTVHYELKFQDLKYVFGPLPPVMHVHAGDILDTTTVDADGKALEEAGLKVIGPNPLTGPFYVDDAEPGDTLAWLIHQRRESWCRKHIDDGGKDRAPLSTLKEVCAAARLTL